MSVPVEQDFYAALQQSAKNATGLNVVPVEVGGAGYFPYMTETTDRLLSGNTYDYVNRRVVPGADGAVSLADPFTGAFHGVAQSITFALSKADEKKLIDAEIAAQAQATAVVGSYEQTYGPITQEQMKAAGVDTKIDYVIDYKVSRVWSGTGDESPPLRLTQADLSDLAALLPYLPSSAQPLLNPIVVYLEKIVSVLSLKDTWGAGKFVRDSLVANSGDGTERNGGVEIVQDDGGHAWVPGWAVRLPMSSILDGLANTAQQLTVEMAVTQIDTTQVQANVSGQGGGIIPIDFLSIGANGSFDLDLYSFQGTGTSLAIEMVFPGLTIVPVEPTRWLESGGTGWYYPKPLYDAVVNGSKDVTGYVFSPTPSYDFGPGGDFGVLTTLLVSQFPTVSVNYTDGNWDEFSANFTQESHWDVRFFGMKIGSFSQSLYVATAKQNDVGGGFTLTMAPAPQTLSVPPLDMVTYVVGAEVTYPGAAPSE